MSADDSREPARIRQMFSAIAARYDLLNRVLSFNLDRLWRRSAASELPGDGGAFVLDLCCGTGDLALAAARQGRARTVVCCDFAHPMLVRAAGRLARRSRAGARFHLVEADGLRLPFRDGSFDAVTVGFGLRNLADLDAGLREILRVLRPAGRLVALEFSRPTRPLVSAAYGFYLRRVLPAIGDAATGRRGAYRYLARTVERFDDAAALAGRLRDAGFAAAGWRSLSAGIVCVHTAFKGPLTPRPKGGAGSPFARATGFPPARR